MRTKNLSMMLAVLCLGGLARGEGHTWYLKGGDDVGYSAMTNAAQWVSSTGEASGEVGAPLNPDDYYEVNSGLNFRTPDMAAFTFPGKSLTLSKDNCSLGICARVQNGCVFTFPDLIVNFGTICNWWGKNPVVKGKVTFVGTASNPVQLYDNGNGSAITFDAEVHGSSESSVIIYNSWDVRGKNTWNQEHCKIIFAGDSLADFHGAVVCRQYRAPSGKTPDPKYRASLVTGGVSNDCSVVLEYRGGLGAAEAAKISIRSLTLADGAFLGVKYDKSSKTASLFEVRDSFTMAGKAVVEFDPGAITAGNYPDADMVPECPVLTAPRGVTLDPAAFELTVTVPFPVYELTVHDNADGLSTLYVKQCGRVIKSTAIDESGGNNWQDCKNNGGAHWSDGEPPALTNLYYCSHEFRAYAPGGVYNDTPVSFPGRTLGFSGAQLDIFAKYYTISDLRVVSTCRIYNYNGSTRPVNLYGNILNDVVGNSYGLRLMGNDGRSLSVYSTIRGGGIVNVQYTNKKPDNHVNIYGTNVNSTGKFVFDAIDASNSAENYIITEFNNPYAFGGDIAAWTFDAHQFGAYVHLKPTESMTLACKNRGCYVVGEATFVIGEDIVFGLTERVTWNGTLHKIGAGMFGFGGEEPYFGSNGTGTTPTEGKNLLMIDEGVLKPLSAAAFNGVAVTLADGVSLVLDVPEKDGADGLAAYGMKFVKAGSALTLPEDGVRVTVADPQGAAKPAANLSRRIPVCTVGEAAASVLRGKFNFGTSPYSGYMLVPTEIDNGDGTVTFAVDLVKGTTLIFR